MAQDTPPSRDWVIFTQKDAFSLDAAYRFAALAAQSQQADRPFTVALTGGSSPITLHTLLASPPFRDAIAWDNVQLFFGDDRCVPPDHPDSNFRMANETLISHVPIPAANVHRIPGELPDHDAAAQQVEADLRQSFQLSEGQFPRFDLILLGMGPDGHCASLFPHKPALHETERLAVASEPGLKPFVPRITLTFPVLNNAANVLFLVAGVDKAETVARVLQGQPAPDTLPSQSVLPTHGTLTWLLDKEAASQLT